MRVIKAKNSGACYGVRRALDMAEAASKGVGEVHTLGELIHNPGVVAHLEQQGVHVAMSIDDIQSGTVVIRSHGVAPAVFDKLLQKGLTAIDATCPHVLRAQRSAAALAREGCHVIVVGEEGHPEVEGIKAHALDAGGTVSVVADGSDVPEGLQAPVGVVVQTTQPEAKLCSVVAALRERGVEPQVKNTICTATQMRQSEARSLATIADAMMVIGGRNSSNTTRLAEICSEQCARTYHIESAEEVEPSMLAGVEVVGITAGASTPTSQIDDVAGRIEELGGILEEDGFSEESCS